MLNKSERYIQTSTSANLFSKQHYNRTTDKTTQDTNQLESCFDHSNEPSGSKAENFLII